MPLANLLAKIEKDALREGEALLAEARSRAEDIISEAEERSRAASERLMREYEEKARRECASEMSAALNDGKSALLETQEMMLRETVDEALRRFEALPDSTYRAWLKGIIIRSARGDETVVAPERERALLSKGLLEEINRELRAAGREGRLEISGEGASFRGGVVLRGDRTLDNLTLEKLAEELVKEKEGELLRILFGEIDIRGDAMRARFGC